MSIEVTVVAELVSATKCTGFATVEPKAGLQIVTEGCVEFIVHCASAAEDEAKAKMTRIVQQRANMQCSNGYLLVTTGLDAHSELQDASLKKRIPATHVPRACHSGVR